MDKKNTRKKNTCELVNWMHFVSGCFFSENIEKQQDLCICIYLTDFTQSMSNPFGGNQIKYHRFFVAKIFFPIFFKK